MAPDPTAGRRVILDIVTATAPPPIAALAADYSLADLVVDLATAAETCRAFGVNPEHFGLDEILADGDTLADRINFFAHGLLRIAAKLGRLSGSTAQMALRMDDECLNGFAAWLGQRTDFLRQVATGPEIQVIPDSDEPPSKERIARGADVSWSTIYGGLSS
jgi:hypothetical protein